MRFNERERLAEPDMSFSSSRLKSELETNVYSAREGATGVFSGGGGAVFVLELKNGMTLIEELEGVEAMIVGADGQLANFM